MGFEWAVQASDTIYYDSLPKIDKQLKSKKKTEQLKVRDCSVLGTDPSSIRDPRTLPIHPAMPKRNSATHTRPHANIAKRLQNFEGKKAPSVDPKILAASTIRRCWRKRFQKNLTYKLIEKYFATGPNIRYVKGIR